MTANGTYSALQSDRTFRKLMPCLSKLIKYIIVFKFDAASTSTKSDLQVAEAVPEREIEIAALLGCSESVTLWVQESACQPRDPAT